MPSFSSIINDLHGLIPGTLSIQQGKELHDLIDSRTQKPQISYAVRMVYEDGQIYGYLLCTCGRDIKMNSQGTKRVICSRCSREWEITSIPQLIAVSEGK